MLLQRLTTVEADIEALKKENVELKQLKGNDNENVDVAKLN